MAELQTNVKQGAVIGGWVCFGVGTAFMFLSLWTVIFYAPLFLAAFVLSIVAMSQRRVAGGLILLLCCVIVPPLTFFSLMAHRAASATSGPSIASAMRVQADLQAIKTQLQLYENMNGFYPTTEQGLQALVSEPQSDPRPIRWYQLFKDMPKDPWGSDYIYRNPGLKNPGSYDLYSAGPDRQPDTSDDDLGRP